MNITNKPVTLDGTTGGEIAVIAEYHAIQVVIAGRATGTVTLTAKSLGGDVFEAFQPALTLDLSVERTCVIGGNSLIALNFEIDAGGADFDATITQWPTN